MKKFIAVLLTLILVLGATSALADDMKKPLKVGVTIYQFNDNFMTLYRTELQKYLEETYGAEVTVVDGKNDQTEQTNQINSFIAEGVDVLIVNLVQSTAAAAVTELAKEAGIPVIYINREPSEDDMGMWEGKICYVGADARQSGSFQGRIVYEFNDAHGDLNGNGKVDYVMIMGDPENVDAQYRTEFSIKYLTDNGVEVNKLFEQRGDWMQENGQQLAATALAQFGKDIDVVFCNNDAMALGAFQAISAANRTVGKDIWLVGVDALDEALDKVSTGEMTGTVFNDHITQSHTAADVAIGYINGEKQDHYVGCDYVKVTKDNVDEIKALLAE